MARVTVEDCINKVENPFELVLLATHRCRQIASQAPITVNRDNDKNAIVALREIAAETIAAEDLKEELIQSLQLYVEVDEPEPEEVPLVGVDSGLLLGPDDIEKDTEIDRLTEEELLNGIESIPKPESIWQGSRHHLKRN